MEKIMKSVAIIVDGLLDTVRLTEESYIVTHLGTVEPASVDDAIVLATWLCEWAVKQPGYTDTDEFKRLQDEAFNNGTFRSM